MKHTASYANAIPSDTEIEKQLPQTNPSLSIFNKAPYNRSGITKSEPSVPTPVTQPPLPQQQQPPSATVLLTEGKVSIRLVNQTGAAITYQVIGDTDKRSLQGKSKILLADLSIPVTVTFRRQDGGLLSVTPQSPQPGILEAILTETTDLGTDKNTMNIEQTGAVFLN